ncbi:MULTISPECIES: gas vesicle protein GvpG [Rhodococcus]|uniref:Gas vesicle synthesis protein n=2 Tax=Rhodococcus TaxID=1827 RepID=M3A215_9NOCA|nr:MULTISPECIES: gas vesicle protein GvpG [Rhodococcus]EME66544.1 gas vesicle synthesis protein [Rhodococcus ruber BKS 20-38]MDM7491171.1 gas vesicle protein GvpG [Rhodococcus indonesiensis]QRE79031.1 gas vesicle protein G [Rhodococcus ruber]RQM35402.1 gas vesicle protein G [Rhodococcus ruber]
MGLISAILTLPLAPVKGVLWLGEVIQDQVEQKMHDPATIRKELEEIDEAAAAGHLSEEEKEKAQQAVLDRMIRPGGGTTPAARGE